MHARCDTDPLDYATDLCDQCGGEYCDDHLVYPYGPKRPPLCRDCAIAVGGVRSGAAAVRRRSRSQVKRRRAELRSLEHERRSTLDAGLGPDPMKRLFQDISGEAPDSAPAAPDPADGADTGRRSGDERPGGGRRSWRRRQDAPADQVPSFGDEGETDETADPGPVTGKGPVIDPTPARTSATVLLSRLRESGAVPTLVGGAHSPLPPAPPPPATDHHAMPPSGRPTPEPYWDVPAATAWPTPAPVDRGSVDHQTRPEPTGRHDVVPGPPADLVASRPGLASWPDDDGWAQPRADADGDVATGGAAARRDHGGPEGANDPLGLADMVEELFGHEHPTGGSAPVEPAHAAHPADVAAPQMPPVPPGRRSRGRLARLLGSPKDAAATGEGVAGSDIAPAEKRARHRSEPDGSPAAPVAASTAAPTIPGEPVNPPSIGRATIEPPPPPAHPIPSDDSTPELPPRPFDVHRVLAPPAPRFPDEASTVLAEAGSAGPAPVIPPAPSPPGRSDRPTQGDLTAAPLSPRPPTPEEGHDTELVLPPLSLRAPTPDERQPADLSLPPLTLPTPFASRAHADDAPSPLSLPSPFELDRSDGLLDDFSFGLDLPPPTPAPRSDPPRQPASGANGPLTSRLIKAGAHPTMGSVLNRTAPPPPPAPTDDDPWAGVPPALRGNGPRPPGA